MLWLLLRVVTFMAKASTGRAWFLAIALSFELSAWLTCLWDSLSLAGIGVRHFLHDALATEIGVVENVQAGGSTATNL
jgi:hypothetical protein